MRYILFKGLENNPDAIDIRKRVFIDEQGFKNEFDEIDKIAYHAVIYVKGKYAAAGRLFGDENKNAHIGRIAVLKDFRGKNLGRLIIDILEKKAAELNFTNIELSAQIHVMDFYSKLGYSPVGEEYLDEGCPHIKMVKKLHTKSHLH